MPSGSSCSVWIQTLKPGSKPVGLHGGQTQSEYFHDRAANDYSSVPPEVHGDRTCRPFNEAIDMWALGLVVAELAAGYLLYPRVMDYELRAAS